MKHYLHAILITTIFVIFYQASFSQNIIPDKSVPAPKIFTFDTDSDQYQELLNGKKDSSVFFSGVVSLNPNSAGELHSTDEYEELIILFQGDAVIKFKNHEPLIIKFGEVALIPKETEHQVINNENRVFKYIYVATQSKK
jgi:mannose-6-phosphate isomerase-like protein (cupin superfamily)